MSVPGTHSDVDVPARNLKPLSFLPALGIFLAIGIWNRVCIYNITPFLEDRGMHQFSAYLTGFLLGLAPLLPVAFVMLRQEGNPMGWASLSNRLGLRRFGGRHFAVMLGLTVVAFVTTLLTSPTQSWITDLSSWLEPGDVFHPLQDPTTSSDSLIDPSVTWMGPDAAGNWIWGIAIVAMFFLNIVGEELLWRGVIWPRQERVHGQRTWLVHGFMWYLFHLPFYPWFAISGIPQAFILSYLFQKTRNTWLVLIMHTIFNSVFYGILLLIVLGIVS
jgi:membrane protease YdiL (CAAX protease family)